MSSYTTDGRAIASGMVALGAGDTGVPRARPTVHARVEPRPWTGVDLDRALPAGSDPACTRVDPETMWPHPTDADGIRAAKAVCRGCAVRDLCLAQHRSEPDGVWGGLTPPERRGAKRHRKPRVAPVPAPVAPAPAPALPAPLARVIRFPVERVRPHPQCPPNVDDCPTCYPEDSR